MVQMNRRGEHTRAPLATVEASASARMRVLKDMGQSEADTLRLALHHAVADLGGLGGIVQVRGPGGSQRFRLVATSGLPSGFTRAWEAPGWRDDTDPGRALRDGEVVWLPSTDPLSGGPPAGTGIVAAPLLAPERGLLAVLSVITTAPGVPSAAERDFLRTVAGWAC
jgi:hypothetical protein